MMKPAKKSLARFLRANRGVAAVEFALIAPVLVTICFGISEMLFRFQVSDQFNRQAYQVADLLTRGSDVQTGGPNDDIHAVLQNANTAIGVGFINNSINLELASIGFEAKKGDPVVLWKRSTNATYKLNPNDVKGFGEKLETLLGVRLTLDANTPYSWFDKDTKLKIEKIVYFRPRVSRLIKINGAEAEQNKNWEVTS